jgi:hypothetical protein
MSDKRKASLVDQLFRAGNMFQEAAYWFRSMYPFLRAKYSGVDTGTFDEIWSKFNINVYLDRLKSLYVQSFSEKELEELLNFWVSPVGHKLSGIEFVTRFRQFGYNWASEVESALKKFVKEDVNASNTEKGKNSIEIRKSG